MSLRVGSNIYGLGHDPCFSGHGPDPDPLGLKFLDPNPYVGCSMSDIGSDLIRKFRIRGIAIQIWSELFRYLNFSDIRTFRIESSSFRIGFVDIFEKSWSVSHPKTRFFFRIPDPKFRIGYFCTSLPLWMGRVLLGLDQVQDPLSYLLFSAYSKRSSTIATSKILHT